MKGVARGIVAALLALAVAACASAGPRRVSVDELPPAHRELLDAYRERDPRWPELRDAALADPDLSRFLVDNLTASMVQAFQVSAIGSHADPKSPFRRAQNELVAIAPASTELLLEMVGSEDPILGHLGAETLERIGEPALGPALALLERPSPDVRRRGAELIGRMSGPAADELEVLAALYALVEGDRDWVVRAQAARAIGERVDYLRTTGALLQALQAAARDEEPLVAVEAARGLGRVGGRDAARTLVELLERSVRDGVPRLWKASQESLVRLSGGGPERKLDGWQAWLAKWNAER